MRHETPPDPHFASRRLDESFGASSNIVPISSLTRIRHDQREQLRARLIELIERNERARRNGRRWLT